MEEGPRELKRKVAALEQDLKHAQARIQDLERASTASPAERVFDEVFTFHRATVCETEAPVGKKPAQHLDEPMVAYSLRLKQFNQAERERIDKEERLIEAQLNSFRWYRADAMLTLFNSPCQEGAFSWQWKHGVHVLDTLPDLLRIADPLESDTDRARIVAVYKKLAEFFNVMYDLRDWQELVVRVAQRSDHSRQLLADSFTPVEVQVFQHDRDLWAKLQPALFPDHSPVLM
jgi:hypothetical protein